MSGTDHAVFMRRALALARRGAGRTSPNPMVGAVLVRGGRVVGEGYHTWRGRHHAEVLALRQAGGRARGARLYSTLEPCSHQGRTPPCTWAIAEAGVSQVFVAARDPNPAVSGAGVRSLRRRGIPVEEGLLEDRARRLNEAYFHFMAQGRPWVLLKMALTLDGRIAARGGDSRWITSERSRRLVHRYRFEHDAVAVGVRTVLKDDPALNVRWRRASSILKVVLDSRLRTPTRARLFESGDPVLLFHAPRAPAARRRALSGKAELVEVRRAGGGLDWQAVLRALGRRKVMSLMVEGGARVAASALRAGVIRKLAFFYGLRLAGGDGLSAIADLGVVRMDRALRVRDVRVRRLDDDLLVEGYL